MNAHTFVNSGTSCALRRRSKRRATGVTAVGTLGPWHYPTLGAGWTTLIAPSAKLVSVILPFKGESSTVPLIIFLCWYTIFCHMFLSSFLTISWHIWHALGWACLIIGFIVPPSTQVRQLVIFQLYRLVSFYFYSCKYCIQLIGHVANGGFTAKSTHAIAISYLAHLYLSK